ncbi:MAG: amidohydrolase [Steroidobacteraceae bacterium]
MRYKRGLATLSALLALSVVSPLGAAMPPSAAQTVYRNGYVYTVDAGDSVQQAVAVRAGRIVYVGTDAGVAAYVGAQTTLVDLGGRMLMPGLIDGHMHPRQGGSALLKCSLNYEQLTVDALQAKIQRCLDATRAQEPDGWLEVVNWFQEGMLPAGVATTRTILDALKTRRPIFVASSFGHTALVNSRAIDIAAVGPDTKDPLGGKIGRDSAGKPNGLLDDAAQELVAAKMPKPSPADDVKSAQAALDALRRQGVTTFLDAMAVPPALKAFKSVEQSGGLTARAHFALLITPPEGRKPAKATADALALARRYDGGAATPQPGLTVRNVKLFLDGVISAPALSGAMLEPYIVAQGSATNRGPPVYFPAPVLRTLLLDVVAAGLEPHMHADGDRAVREGLDGIEAVRKAYPGKDVRCAIAHDEIVDPADFERFRRLDAIPVLSFQWEKPASDTIDNARSYMGAGRFKYLEPAGFLAAAGARLAFGSDWPVDPLDEWFAVKVGVTRTNAPSSGAKYAGRLSEDPGLSRQTALRAITLNAAYELHADHDVGSIEVGKLADLIVLDRNVLDVPEPQIAETKVLQTMVGGRVVYRSESFPEPL